MKLDKIDNIISLLFSTSPMNQPQLIVNIPIRRILGNTGLRRIAPG